MKVLFPRGDARAARLPAGRPRAPRPAGRGRGRRRAGTSSSTSSPSSWPPGRRMVRLITWNVARRVEALAAQAAALGEREPDVIALQEVTARTLPLWEAACATLGLPHVRLHAARRRPGARAGGAAADRRAARGARRRWSRAGARWTCRGRRARSRRGSRGSRCTPSTSRTPPTARSSRARSRRSARGWRARSGRGRRARALRRPQHAAARASGRHRLVLRARRARARCARSARASGTRPSSASCPACASSATATPSARWHGYASREPSWTFRRISGHGGGWRLDHIFCSAELVPAACAYHHDWRDAGLSDHSALEADLADDRARPCSAR